MDFFNEVFLKYILPAIIGIASSVIASILFLRFYLTRKVPIINVSPWIANESDETKTEFWFKYVNATGVPIYEVEVEAYFLTPSGATGGQNLIIDKIELKHSTYRHIPGESILDPNASHAVQVRSTDDVLSKWNNSASFIRFEVIAKHELSGFSRVVVTDFHHKNQIKPGTFVFGNSLEVL